MSKHMPGFVPVNFNKTGKILFIVSLACIIAKLVSGLTEWFSVSNYITYLGLGLLLISLYLMFIVPKE